MGNTFRQQRPASFFMLEEVDTTHADSRSDSSINPIFNPKRGNPNHHSHNSSLLSQTDSSQLRRHKKREEISSTDPNLHTTLWLAGFIFFAIVDCLLIVLLIQLCLELAEAPNSSSSPPLETSSLVANPSLLEDRPFCLPCSQVYVNRIEVLQNRARLLQRMDEDSNDTLCCAPAHDDLKGLVGKMFLRVHYERDRASGQVTMTNVTETTDDDESDVSTHLLLQLDAEREPQEVNGTHTVPLTLTKRSAPAIQANSAYIFFQNDVINVAHSGHFYIHSHVPFYFTLQPAVLTQYVYRVRNGGELLLLENSVYPCDVTLRSCEHSFVGGVFLLEKGDQVVLRVSNHSYVEKQKEVEFGIHML